MTIYMVGSVVEAARVTDALRDSDAILAQLGEATFAARVVVAATAAEADAIARVTAEADTIRATLGLPPVSLLDLRAP